MSEEAKKSTKFAVGCTSWIGVLLSIAIIAIRAFQPSAQPIESWSAGSWILMLLPIFLPFITWIMVIIALAICWIVAELTS